MIHPKTNDQGKPVIVHDPHMAKPGKTFVPGGEAPEHINGLPLKSETDPHSGLKLHNDDHTFTPHPHKRTASGMVVVEPDHHVWICSPTNRFGGYDNTFPKGGHEHDSPSLQHTAAKEAWEETGLKAQPTHHLGDYERTTSKTRMYVGHRVGGHPSDMGWESQAVHLVHIDDLHKWIHSPADQQVVRDLKVHLSKQKAQSSIKDKLNLFRK